MGVRFNVRERDRLDLLDRRRRKLEARLETYRPGGNPEYTRRELIALTWALRILSSDARLFEDAVVGVRASEISAAATASAVGRARP